MPTDRAAVQPSTRPRLTGHVRRSYDRVRERQVLLGPESVTVLNASGAAILELCDGQRSVADIARELGERFSRDVDGDVTGFLNRLAAKGYLEFADG